MFTEEELQITQDEHIRAMGRMAIDIGRMMSQGIPQDVATVFGRLLHDKSLLYTVQILNVNGVDALCILLNFGDNKTAIFPMVNNSFTLKTQEGVALTFYDNENPQEKSKLN